MTVLSTWISLMLALTFAQAAVTHVAQQARFRRVLTNIGAPFPAAATYLVTASDVLVVALLVAEPGSGLVAAAVYLFVVTGWMLTRLRHGPIADCGCATRPAPVDGTFVFRNGALLLGSGLALAGPRATLGDLAYVTAALLVALYVGVQRAFELIAGSQLRSRTTAA